ncbi:MAG: 2-oxoacid:ferredoxin oxidoreductase subunit beta [Candidatus Eisenbacteria bacterium]|uniref:2-oxoacid:ferredoxin oxidoreductase subunit beta n=1 Tax=Eiseniibacteriota bacterium TaxID=2212470 RepID=A0A538TDY3_UNCEI|nr:MAG: 2-oxoacid:ferredoxin oxidoreductase subunit beta [Candidatus Eisenbacteria bacterium]
MSATPAGPARNRAGLTRADYDGSKTTLCPGCGHNAITAAIIQAAFEAALEPSRVAKLSGIGCSSKTPAYFLGQTHGFNAVHGRMPSIATGVRVAQRDLLLIGVSGDGDTASIGLGQFCHLIRRNVPVVYIIENNGVYGLTKGQFSATADQGSTMKGGKANELMPIDCCAIALELGCGFVARSFSGDQKQLRPLLKAAFAHRGTAVIDVISPCVTFADHEGSTKSYAAVKEHDVPLHDIDYVPYFEDIHVDYEPGTTREVTMPDGSRLVLKKLGEDYDPTSRERAVMTLQEARREQKLLTGLFFVDPQQRPYEDELGLVDDALASLPLERVRPPERVLAEIMEQLRTGKGLTAPAGGG